MSDPERPSPPSPPAPPTPAAPPEPPEPPAPPARKDRLVQTRVPRELESRVKAEAHRRRLSVSQLVRNILEDTVDLVDGVLGSVDEIVGESVSLAEDVSRDALRVARRATREIRRDFSDHDSDDLPDDDDLGGAVSSRPASDRPDDDLAHVDAWNPVIMNRSTPCSRCHRSIERGARGYAGLGEGPPAWLCERCLDEL